MEESECCLQTSSQEDGELSPNPKRDQEFGQYCNDNYTVSAAATACNLKLKIPLSCKMECEKEEEDDDGFKTPTSSDHKIPAILQCPPAPTKPKSIPSRKRIQASAATRIQLDFSKQIDSLFPSSLDLGSKIKKLKRGIEITLSKAEAEVEVEVDQVDSEAHTYL